MIVFKGCRTFALTVFSGYVLFGCVTGNSPSQDSASPLAHSEQNDGQGTTVTAEGLIKHEETCIPIAETDRLQPPSVELGVTRNLTAEHTITRPYTRFNCR